MKSFSKYIQSTVVVAAMVASATGLCSADHCLSHGDSLNMSHSLYSESIDPYAHLLPTELQDTNALATSYNLELKPMVVNDLTQLQFNTYDSRSPAAGYTSPYLWEAGGGPGYRSNSRYPGFSPSPFPVRR